MPIETIFRTIEAIARAGGGAKALKGENFPRRRSLLHAGGMNGLERMAGEWREILALTGDAGRAWRKSLVLRLAARISDAEALRANPCRVKAEIKADRRLRTDGHWLFRPERLRWRLALYLRAKAARRIAA